MKIKKFSYLLKESSLPSSVNDISNNQSLLGWLSGAYLDNGTISSSKSNIIDLLSEQDGIILYCETSTSGDGGSTGTMQNTYEPHLFVKVIDPDPTKSDIKSYMQSHYNTGFEAAKALLNFGNSNDTATANSPYISNFIGTNKGNYTLDYYMNELIKQGRLTSIPNVSLGNLKNDLNTRFKNKEYSYFDLRPRLEDGYNEIYVETIAEDFTFTKDNNNNYVAKTTTQQNPVQNSSNITQSSLNSYWMA